jgi:two-component system cell cycle response regulator
MQAKRRFEVEVIGLSEREFTVLKSIERISTARVRSYVFFEGKNSNPGCDIYIVDGDNPSSMALWSRHRATHSAPAIVISENGADFFGQRGFRRPLIVSRLVSLLDEVTTHELHFLPELSIGHDVVPDPAHIKFKSANDARFLALVVDDSPTVRKQIELGLKLAGCAVDSAETVSTATLLLKSKPYDIVFLDVVLPDGDGYQLCKLIKRDKVKARTPVVMLTGKTSPLDQIKGSLAGCDSYLTKPVHNSVFQQVVRKYLGRIAGQEIKVQTGTG